jgi:hypothetical protein
MSPPAHRPYGQGMRDRRPSLVLSSLILGTAIVLASTAGAVAGSLITGKQIKDNTVTTKDIKDGTLAAKDLAPATVAQLKGGPGTTGATGAAGPTGPPGAQGPQGVAGTNGVSGYETVQALSPVVANGAFASITASCPSGKQIVGATAYWENSDEAVQIFPGGGASTTVWVAKDQNPGSSDHIVFRVVCITT